MSKGKFAVLALILAAGAPSVASAKSYNGFDYGFGYDEGAAVSRNYSREPSMRYDRRGYARDNGYRARNRNTAKGYGGYSKGRTYAKAYTKPYAAPSAGVPMANRGFSRFSSTSPETSTTCLSGEAQVLLGRIKAQFGTVEIVSTCRPGATIAGTGYPSKHASGQAIDFRVPGRKAEVVQWLIANDQMGGIMTYSDMDHIHVDVGQRFVALNRPSGRT